MKIKIPKIKKNYHKESFRINPNIYWRIIVVLFLIIIVIIAIFAYNLFNKVNKENDPTLLNSSAKIEKEKKDKINKVLEYFSNREKKSNEIINSPSGVIDPSL